MATGCIGLTSMRTSAQTECSAAFQPLARKIVLVRQRRLPGRSSRRAARSAKANRRRVPAPLAAESHRDRVARPPTRPPQPRARRPRQPEPPADATGQSAKARTGWLKFVRDFRVPVAPPFFARWHWTWRCAPVDFGEGCFFSSRANSEPHRRAQQRTSDGFLGYRMSAA